MTGSLRSAWYEAQRRDGSLAGILGQTEHPFVLGGDGLLEREVQLAAGRVVRVAVVLNGIAGATWFDMAPSLLQPGPLWDPGCS